MLDNINCVPHDYNPSTVVPEEQPEPAAEEEEEELDPVAGALFEDVVHAMKQNQENSPYISFNTSIHINGLSSKTISSHCVSWWVVCALLMLLIIRS